MSDKLEELAMELETLIRGVSFYDNKHDADREAGDVEVESLRKAITPLLSRVQAKARLEEALIWQISGGITRLLWAEERITALDQAAHPAMKEGK